MAGVFYVYSRKRAFHEVIHKLPGKTAGVLIGSIIAATGVGTSITYRNLVEKPLLDRTLECDSCGLTRGAGIGGLFTFVGMLGVSSVHAYQFVTDKSILNLTRHSFRSITSTVYGCTILLIAMFCGMAVTHKIIRDIRAQNG